MSIRDLKQIFLRINPNGGINPHGNCMHCAVEAAGSLVAGRFPRQVDGTIGDVNNNGIPRLIRFGFTANRATQVLNWLRFTAPTGVYAIDAEDHAYNVIILNHPRSIILLDSNQHVCRKIDRLQDGAAVGHNEELEDRYDYNYLSPEASDEDGSDLDFYHWGPLHAAWHRIISTDNKMVNYTPGGAATIG